MTDFLIRVAIETWYILKEASIFLLFGFALAGMLAVLVRGETLRRLFGTGKVKSVLWASALGIPLPLCSCGVLPTALGMRRQGATKGATVSFLISTPETGVDSISLSYALMDPIITVFRPVAAMVTAIIAGLATNFFGEPRRRAVAAEGAAPEPTDHQHHGHDHHHSDEQLADESRPVDALDAARRIYRYAFCELLDETSYWLVLGIVLSGIIAATLPPTFFEQYLSGGLTSMLVMLLIGIPIYTCASSSTPIAAALVLKGLNPGAALVFLLAGPATNVGSLTVLLKFLGARVVAIYLGTIVVVTLLAGFALNWVYQAWTLDPQATFGAGTAFIPESVKSAGALALIAFLLISMRRTHVPGEWLWVRDRFAALAGLRVSARRLKWATIGAAVGLYFWSGLFTVQPGEIGVRFRFGDIVSPELEPGLHYRLPWPFESHDVIQRDYVRRAELGFRSAEVQALAERALARERLTVGGPSNPVPTRIKATGFWFQKEAVPEESFLLTGDGNLIDLRFTVQYQAIDPIAFTYTLAQPDELVRSTALAVLRGVVGTSSIDAVLTTHRVAVEERVRTGIQDLLDAYQTGVHIVAVQLLYAHPPQEVHAAFRDVASAQEDKLRTVNRARTFAVEKVNKAEGEAAARIESALAFKDEQVLRASGDATGFTLKVDAYRRAPELTRFRLQIETIEAVLPGTRKLVRPGADDVRDFDLWLLKPFAGGG